MDQRGPIREPYLNNNFPPERPARTGIFFAMAAAVLFGVSTPFSKILVRQIEPVLLAGLLYLGSGVGLATWSGLRRLTGHNHAEARLTAADYPWLAGAVVSGGVVAPILLMTGLRLTPASSASLLLNLEGVLTALLAWFVFKENFDRRIALGMTAITMGSLLLSWSGRPHLDVPWGAIAIAGACFGWAVDNNLTRKVSSGDPLQIAAIKGLVAGSVNVTIALAFGVRWPGVYTLTGAALIGFLSYGVSLTLFVLALRHIGTARTGAYFSLAPFVGAAIAIPLLKDSLTIYFFGAAVLMGIGVWLHLTERHEHEHWHDALEHNHRHSHDEHHRHHDDEALLAEAHSHPHRHKRMRHSHPHYPDIHHRHEH